MCWEIAVPLLYGTQWGKRQRWKWAKCFGTTEVHRGRSQEIFGGADGRTLDARLRALNLNLLVMGCHAGICLLGCLQASSADKVLGTKESYPKSLLFLSIKGVLFHLLTVKTGRIIMLWLLWSWSQWWKKSYEAELRDKCLKSWLQGFTLTSSRKALLDKEVLLMSFTQNTKQNKPSRRRGQKGVEVHYSIPGARVPADPWRGHCTAYWSCASCRPPPSSLPGCLLLRQFPLCPANDTSLIYWFAIFQMTTLSFFFFFILLHVAVQFSQQHLLKRLSFLHCISLPPLS